MDARNGKWVNVDYASRGAAEADEGTGDYGSRPYVGADEGFGLTDAEALAEAQQHHGPPYGGGYGFGEGGQRSGGGGGRALVRNAPPPLTTATAAATAAAGEAEEYYIEITVSEPVKQGEGMNAYISYKITTATNRPQFTKSTFSVIRRYSDFIWLHANLSALFPGVVVPPLPEKLLVGRFSPEFIESRRRALQLFLHRCCLHPELQHSEHLTTFLEATDEALAAFKADPNKTVTKGARGSIFQWIDETVNTISSTLGSTAGVNLEKTAADVEVEEMMTYIDGLEPIMTGLHKHAHGLTKRAREIADGLFEFGVAYALLGKSEENPSLQEGLREIGSCADRLSLLAAEHAEKEALHFEEPILDYIRLVGAVKAALQKRNEVRGSYGAAVADLESKTGVANKLAPRGQQDEKYQIAEGDVMKAQQRVDDAKLEYDIVTERVLREVERFKREKVDDFKRIILDYVQMQVAYSKKVEEEWHRVIPRLQNIHIDVGSPSTSSIASASLPGSGANSLIQENYIPSIPSSGSRAPPDSPDIMENLLSLSLDQESDDGRSNRQSSGRMTRIQVRSPYGNPDVAL